MDKNPESYQWLILFVVQAIALVLISQLNLTLATVSLFLFINGLFIAFPALFLPIGQGFTLVFLFSIFYDSGESWAIGTSLAPNLITFTIVYYLRHRIRYIRTGATRPVILLVNLVLFLFYTILAGIRFPVSSEFVFLNLVHLLTSELVLLLIANPLIVFQKDVLLMFKVDLAVTSRAPK